MRQLTTWKPRALGDCCTPDVGWESDGSSGSPMMDLQWAYNACARHIRSPEFIVVNGPDGLRDLVRRLAACTRETKSFVGWCREIQPAELRRAVLRSEIERRKA